MKNEKWKRYKWSKDEEIEIIKLYKEGKKINYIRNKAICFQHKRVDEPPTYHQISYFLNKRFPKG